MNIHHSVRQRLLVGTIISGAVLAMAGSVSAQAFAGTAAVSRSAVQGQDTQDPPVTEIEEVVVTGSLIRRDPTTSPTPLVQVAREEILEQGEANIVDFLADIPALQNSVVPEDTTGGLIGVGGLALLNLRNLGAGRTLVLVDGRRHVGSQAASPSVDVDTIPTPLIQSVEIITGGASSLYGADAVSGVVNFIMRRDYEGVEFDGGISQLTQGERSFNQRGSVLAGHNFMGGRGNVYAFGEYQTSDRVNDDMMDIDWLVNNERLFSVDFDTTGTPNDGVRDVERVSGVRVLSRPLGGLLTIANGQRPTAASDPDIGFSFCGTNGAGTAIAPENANVFSVTRCFPMNAGFSYRFNPGGAPFLADFGAGQLPTGRADRPNAVGGNGDGLVEVDTNRLPEQENKRFQFGGNFDINDNVQVFSELKYVDETNIDIFQPFFSDIGIRTFAPGEHAVNDGLVGGRIGLDNAFLDPAIQAQIQGNVRTVYGANGTVLGTQADPRASFRLFAFDLGFRPAVAERVLTRFVGGFRGEFDQLAFLKDGQWEIGYTRGVADSVTTEPETIDLQRFMFSADAVRDPLNLTGKGANAIVCRVQLLAAQGLPVANGATGQNYAPNDPTIRDCIPSNIFGLGGQTVARPYILTKLITEDRNEQSDVRAFMSGQLWDFWGAGPIGVALGAEYREERTKSDLTEFGDRILFANAFGDLAKVGFDVAEGFAELQLPLLRDLPFAESVELTGAYRYSDYSLGNQTETFSTALFWRPIQDIAFRGTYGEAVRAPTLGQLFTPPGQTFPNLTDACSQPIINSTGDQRIRENRIRNCAAQGIPSTYIDPRPTTSNEGLSGSNPNLQNEESISHTLSMVITPRMFPDLNIVVDYYSIDITNAIATLTAQQLVNLCYDEDVSNTAACNQLTRDPNTFEIINFLQGPFNFAGLRARGIDYQARYGLDLEEVTGQNWGRLDFSISGNYLIRIQNFTNPTNPNAATEIDKTANNPRVRFRTNTTWTQGPLSVSWRFDMQTATVILENRGILTNTDSRDPEYFNTGNFYQHDVSFGYEVDDNLQVRGGVTNLFDAEPSIQAGLQDQFDLFGRRYFLGLTYSY